MLKDLLDSNGFVAIVTSLFGGAGLAIVSKLLNRGESKSNQATQFRDEQRQEIESLRAQITELKNNESKINSETDAWQDKYYKLLIEKQGIDNELNNSLKEIESLKRHRDNLLGPR